MADVSGKFYSATKVRTGVSPSSPGVEVGETLPPVNPPGGGLNSVGLTMPSAFAVANSPLTSNGTLEVTGAGTTAQYIRGDGSLASFPSLTGYVPYTGATADVDLGTHDLTAERGTFQNNGSSDTLTVNHTSGSGYGIKVTKGGNNEALYVSKTSGSGNAMTVIGGRTSLVDLALSSVTNTAGDFLTLSGGVVHKRTAAEVRTDIGAGTVTSVAALTLGTSGTDLSSTVANGTTTPVITLNVPTASASNRGALSSADWTTFNSKQAQLNGTGFVKASGTTISYDNTNYLPLTGGTLTGPLNGTSISLSGDITANRYRGVNSLVLNSYTTVNPSSNVYLYSPGNDRDAWVYLDSATIDSNWGIYHRQIDSAVSGLPANSIGFIGGGSNTLQAWISLENGNGFFAGNLTTNSFIKSGGTSGQFLKADGSVDSTTYVPVGRTITINGTTQDLSANRTFNVGTVTSVTASSPLFSSGGATPNITIQQASGSQNGFLSSTDWTTFNNKQNALTNPVTGTGVSGRVAFWNGTNTITSDSDLLFNGNTLTLLTGNVEIAAGNGLILFNPDTTNYFQLYTNNGNELNFGFGGTTPVVAKISSSGTMTLTGDIFIQKAAPSVQLRAGNGSNAGFILANSSNTHNWTFESDFGAAGQQGELRIRNSILGSNAITISTSNAATFSSSVTAASIIRSGGSSSQYLMADGSVSTLSNPVTGTGTTNYLPKFTGTTTIGNSNLINDSSGNLGLAVSPSAWSSGKKAYQTLTSSFVGDSGRLEIWFNGYFDGDGEKYIGNGFSTLYTQLSGNHIWSTAPNNTSGAGAAISYTQAMTLTSGGNLLIGTGTNGLSRLRIVGLPTSSAGLSSGDVYNLAGVLMIA
jgi:hypothetical protein